MKHNAILFLALMCTGIIGHTQLGNIYEMPRVMVNGEATIKVEADVIYAWLNINDNMVTYDYTTPYDDKAFKKKQQEIIDRTGLKNALVSPSYVAIASGAATSPFQLKFNSKAEFEAAQLKALKENGENYTVTLDFASAEISMEKRKTITNQMLDQAIIDARAKAERLVKGLGTSLGKVLYIEEIADYYAQGTYDYGYGEGGYNIGASDMMVSISAKVQVQYELK